MDNFELLYEAYHTATYSNDRSTQNGCLLVDDGEIIARVCNDIPRGVKVTEERLTKRPDKYWYSEHAERAAIYYAAKYGIRTAGTIMVCCWAPCPDCARAIVLGGLSELVTHKQALDRSHDQWKENTKVGINILKEAGVEVTIIDGKVTGVNGRQPIKLLHGRELWEP